MTPYEIRFAKWLIRAIIALIPLFFVFVLAVGALGGPVWKLREFGIVFGTPQLVKWTAQLLVSVANSLLSPPGLIGLCVGACAGGWLVYQGLKTRHIDH